MVNLHVFSRRTGFLFFKDYALGLAITLPKKGFDRKALEEDHTAARIGLYNFTDKHKGRCKDLFIVVDDGEEAVPYVLGLLGKLYAEPDMAKRIARLNCKVECPKMSAEAAQALSERIRTRDFL